jgi:BRCA1-associated protein
MPEYFFSIGLELLPNPNAIAKHATDLHGCSVVSQALAPFTRDNRQKQGPKCDSLANLSISRSHHSPPLRLGLVSDAPRSAPFHTVPSSTSDNRLDEISIESMDVTRAGQKEEITTKSTNSDKNHVTKGIGTAISGLQTKGSYVPLDQRKTGSVWGIVHLYRDAEETPGLYGDSPLSKPTDPWLHGFTKESVGPKHPRPSDQDCTTLCILAVPSYMAPSDFLGFVGEETWNEVSHFRMIRTARANRYMVLMKFRHGKKAREWQQEWNGKVFNTYEVSKQPRFLISLLNTMLKHTLAGDLSRRLLEVRRDHAIPRNRHGPQYSFWATNLPHHV